MQLAKIVQGAFREGAKLLTKKVAYFGPLVFGGPTPILPSRSLSTLTLRQEISEQEQQSKLFIQVVEKSFLQLPIQTYI